MPKYDVQYRGGEVYATIEAEDPDEAVEKFLAGECDYGVVSYLFHSDMIEVMGCKDG